MTGRPPLTLASAIIALLMMAFAARASAAPAKVVVFEAKARERPADDAKIVHVFPEGAAISVSEEADADGWRRVRLPDGTVGFVRGADIAVAGRPAQNGSGGVGDDAGDLQPGGARAPAEPLPRRAAQQSDDDDAPAGAGPRRSARTPAALLYVKDLDHLASLVERDHVVAPMAQALASKRTTANVVGLGSVVVGGGIAIAGLLLVTKKDCVDFGPGQPPSCLDRPNYGFMWVGTAVMGVGALAWLILHPTRSDLIDVVNTWNTRHPDEPFSITVTSPRRTGFGF